ncbi:MAG TPA: hypothetical protein VL945_00975, partial [Candidatus Saccharimonadales bacterium]|nr:hypothetical protein [Candidatus Saccharimonadales bacterium]
PAEKAGLIEYHCENSEKARWRDLIRRASEIGPFHLTLVINRIVGRSPNIQVQKPLYTISYDNI